MGLWAGEHDHVRDLPDRARKGVWDSRAGDQWQVCALAVRLRRGSTAKRTRSRVGSLSHAGPRTDRRVDRQARLGLPWPALGRAAAHARRSGVHSAPQRHRRHRPRSPDRRCRPCRRISTTTRASGGRQSTSRSTSELRTTAQHDRVHRLAGIRDEGLPIIVDWLLIVAGFALLVGGGEALVRGAGGIALGGRP